ncbi:MAG: hypothetical protein LBN09_00710 [Clostridioides sp.]|jgi:hypothetical protein|nr:hypothetical protein [Clostridioides sp.]
MASAPRKKSRDGLVREGEKLLIIKIFTHTGDKVEVKLPMEFAKMMIEGNVLDFFEDSEGSISSEKATELIAQAFDYNLSGEIISLERHNKDLIKVYLD